MKNLSITEQINACQKHANRNNLKIDRWDIYNRYPANHQVIAHLPPEPSGSIPYFSVSVLINSKKAS